MTEGELKEHKYRFIVQHHAKVVSVTAIKPVKYWNADGSHVITITKPTREEAMALAVEAAIAHYVQSRLAA